MPPEKLSTKTDKLPRNKYIDSTTLFFVETCTLGLQKRMGSKYAKLREAEIKKEDTQVFKERNQNGNDWRV